MSTLSLGPNRLKQALKRACLEPELTTMLSAWTGRPPANRERLLPLAARGGRGAPPGQAGKILPDRVAQLAEARVGRVVGVAVLNREDAGLRRGSRSVGVGAAGAAGEG